MWVGNLFPGGCSWALLAAQAHGVRLFIWALRVARLLICITDQPGDCMTRGQVTPIKQLFWSFKFQGWDPLNARMVTGIAQWSHWWVGGRYRVCVPAGCAQQLSPGGMPVGRDACGGLLASHSVETSCSSRSSSNSQDCHWCALARCCLPDTKDYLRLNCGPACC